MVRKIIKIPFSNKSGVFLNIEVFINKLKYYGKNCKIN